MAKTKISEFDVDPSNNTDINSINIAEGCAPSGINNAIRQLMSDLKEFQTGASGDDFTVAGALDITGTLELDGSTGSAGQVLVSAGSGSTPTWGSGFPSGGIIIWSGAANAIPSGWLLCDGTNSTPNLRDRFVVGAGSTYAVGATGGSADAIVVSHTHTATSVVTDSGHTHSGSLFNEVGNGNVVADGDPGNPSGFTYTTNSSTTGITVATTNASTGSSGTNANLPPYYALCYIMKS
jgi:microcystin-dependent protein